MATFTTLLVTTLGIFSNIEWVFSQEYEALAVITNASTPSGIDLPQSATEQNGQIIYPEKAKDGSKIEYSYLCPPQTDELVQNLKNASKQHPELEFCLEENLSNKKPIKCPEEVKPVLNLRRDQDGFEKQCGKSTRDVIYDFGFHLVKLKNDAGPSIIKPNQPRKLTMLRVYEVCFNESKPQTIWTKHRLTTASMLQGSGLPSQKIQPPYEFNEEHYGLQKSIFSNMAEEYKIHERSNPRYKMIPQMIVPQEDIALKMWKKTATHFANTEKLWVDLAPLMKAINDGIRKAVISVSVNIDKSNINQGDTVYIYTAVYSYTHRLPLDDLVESTDRFNNNRFGLNVWCKFIHNETKNTGVMIYLHNLPDSPPIKIDSTSDDSESKILFQNTECERPLSCDFQKWADESAGLSDDLVNYAYCCEVNNEKVAEIFSVKLNDKKLDVFDIDHFNSKE